MSPERGMVDDLFASDTVGSDRGSVDSAVPILPGSGDHGSDKLQRVLAEEYDPLAETAEASAMYEASSRLEDLLGEPDCSDDTNEAYELYVEQKSDERHGALFECPALPAVPELVPDQSDGSVLRGDPELDKFRPGPLPKVFYDDVIRPKEHKIHDNVGDPLKYEPFTDKTEAALAEMFVIFPMARRLWDMMSLLTRQPWFNSDSFYTYNTFAKKRAFFPHLPLYVKSVTPKAKGSKKSLQGQPPPKARKMGFFSLFDLIIRGPPHCLFTLFTALFAALYHT
jgi:hypothetical protein